MKKKSKYIQDFIPVKDIKSGIVETTDGRFLKILEIEPINFNLRTPEEQEDILYTFAGWLKVAPVKLQFKSITRRADCLKYIAKLKGELLNEQSWNCQELGKNHINLVGEVGCNQALSRRFFLVLEYESAQRGDEFAKAYSALYSAEQTARSYFLQCGNSIVKAEDENEATVEMLYTYFNRKTAEKVPFMDKVESVIAKAMTAQGRVIGEDAIPEIPIIEFIAPDEIDFTHYNYVVMDGKYYSYLFIKGEGFPKAVKAGWMSAFIDAGDGIDVDVFLRKENRNKAIDKVAQKIRLNRTKIKGMQDTSTDYEEITDSIQAGYYIKHGMANNEDLYYLSIFITVSGNSLEELTWRKQHVVTSLKSLDVFVCDCKFRQEEALQTVMPFGCISPVLEKRSKRNVLTSGASSTYMFTSYEMSDDAGVMLGVNRYNNSLCILDLFDSKKYKNANLNLIGTSGAGKTFTLQLLAMRMRLRGIQCFTLAPIKGHEFLKACNEIGGTFISLAPGSPHCINVMEIRPTLDVESPDSAYHNFESLLSKKIQQLMIFFGLLVPDLTNEEEQLLDEAIIATYAAVGITHDNGSIYENGKLKVMPILGDLHKELQKEERIKRVANILSRFVTGSAQSFMKVRLPCSLTKRRR